MIDTAVHFCVRDWCVRPDLHITRVCDVLDRCLDCENVTLTMSTCMHIHSHSIISTCIHICSYSDAKHNFHGNACLTCSLLPPVNQELAEAQVRANAELVTAHKLNMSLVRDARELQVCPYDIVCLHP